MPDVIPSGRRFTLRYWRKLVVFFVGSLFLALIGLSAALGIRHGNSEVFPARVAPCCETPATYGLSYRDVSFQTDDGLTLRGWYIPSQNRAAIIAAHGHGGNRVGVLAPVVALAKRGYGLLLIDLRAHGVSDGDKFAFGWRDGVAAAKFLKQQADVDSSQIGIVGFSLGAVMALQSAARTSDIAAVVADGIGAATLDDMPARTSLLDWWALPYDIAAVLTIQVQTSETLTSMKTTAQSVSPRPILLITYSSPQSEADIEPKITRSIYDAITGPKDLWVIQNVGHVGGFASNPQAYTDRLIQFFDKALLGG
jgi:alpha/beta superfamily hydrolase